MEDRIENYIEELKPLCNTCRKSQKCISHDKICLAKRLAWNYAKRVYKQRVKKGIIKE